MRTISTYSRIRPRPRSNGTPYQPSETCGPERPSPRRMRPPEIVSIVAAAIAAAVGWRAGICISAEPMPIRSVRSARIGEDRDDVLAPRLGDPDALEPRLVGGERELDLLLEGEPGPVCD